MKIPTDDKSLFDLKSNRNAKRAQPMKVIRNGDGASLAYDYRIKRYKMEGNEATRIQELWIKARTANEFVSKVEQSGERLALMNGHHCIVNKAGDACYLFDIIDVSSQNIHKSLINIVHKIPHVSDAITALNSPHPDDAGAVLDAPAPGENRSLDNARQQDQGQRPPREDDAGAVLDEPAPDNKPSSPEKPRDDRGDID